MTKFNYNEPEFKVVAMASQDVLTASFESVTDDWDTINKGDTIDAGNLFSM
jgi:hypothetical protein